MKNRLLLHTCCAPCSTYVVDKLRKDGYDDITAYWYNINIHPFTEYKMRLDTLKQYAEMINLPLVIDYDYGIREFTRNVANNIDARCYFCYYSRLERTVKYAKENGYDSFSTTLLVSPYQKHELIIKIANELSEKYGIPFIYQDFREGFRIGQQMARDAGLYMQKYCGCIYSEWTSNDDNNKVELKLPEGLDFLPVEQSIVIRKVRENKEQYMSLLLEADPGEKLIRQYLVDGDLFVLTYKNEVACVAIVTKVDDDICELKNIATEEKYRGKGYTKKMLKYLCDNYKQKYHKMLVGTTENNIPFYVKQGFDKYEKTAKNFFIDNYDEKIKDGELVCTDLIYYSKELKKKENN